MTETILKWGWILAIREKTFSTFPGGLKIGVKFGLIWMIFSTFFGRQGRHQSNTCEFGAFLYSPEVVISNLKMEHFPISNRVSCDMKTKVSLTEKFCQSTQQLLLVYKFFSNFLSNQHCISCDMKTKVSLTENFCKSEQI